MISKGDAVDIAAREIPSDELQDAIASAQASLLQACDAVGTGQDPVRLVLAGLSDTIGIFGKSIRRWERAVADVIAARKPVSDNDRAELVEAVEVGAYNGMRKEAQRMVRTFDRNLAAMFGISVGGAFIVGALAAWALIAITHWGPYSHDAQSQAAWRDLIRNNPDPRPALSSAEIKTDRTGRHYYSVRFWMDPAKPPDTP
jgi:hypothetical protein